MPRQPENSGDVVPVGTSSTQVVPANPERYLLIIVNDSDTKIYLRFSSEPATVGQGVPLYPYGSALTLSGEEHPFAVTAIHNNQDGSGGTTTGSTKNLTIVDS